MTATPTDRPTVSAISCARAVPTLIYARAGKKRREPALETHGKGLDRHYTVTVGLRTWTFWKWRVPAGLEAPRHYDGGLTRARGCAQDHIEGRVWT